MSKTFQSRGKPKTAQHSSVSVKDRVAAVDSRTVRRTGVNYVPDNKDLNINVTDVKTDKKEEKSKKKLPVLNSPQKRAAKKIISEDELVKPETLKLRTLAGNHLLFPSVHGIVHSAADDDDETVGSTSIKQNKPHGGVSLLENEDCDDDESILLQDKLLGMPGGLYLDAETTSRYFGEEARFKFMQRVQWLAAQRNIACIEADDYMDALVFNDSVETETPLEYDTPFHAYRKHADGRGEAGGGGSTQSILTQRQNRGSQSSKSSNFSANETHMLQQSQMRSGQDYRDEEDEDNISPMRAAAREKDMLEELDRILKREQGLVAEDLEAQAAAIEEEEAYQARILERELENEARMSQTTSTSATGVRDKVRSIIRSKTKSIHMAKEDSWKHIYISAFGETVLEDTPRGQESKNFKPPSGGNFSSSSSSSKADVFDKGNEKTKDKVKDKSKISSMSRVGAMKGKEKATAAAKNEQKRAARPSAVSELTFEALSLANQAMGTLPGPSANPMHRQKNGIPIVNNTDADDLSVTTEITRSSGVSTTGLRGEMLLGEVSVSQEMYMSPRSQYISNCIREGLNPRASLIVRKKMTKRLELQNYGIGDTMAAILAQSIAELPFLQSINIADNGLTDDGMGPIIRAAVQIKGLLELNLSKNEIGDESSAALAAYLKRPDCPLEKLVMQTADVDDFEAEGFINAVMENRSLLELDLSSNLIGGAENLNTVMPELVTGSEALADLLRTDGIRLQTLKLVWNMIRLDGAVDFCSSLAINKTLTYLDVSYNSLAQDGGIALGKALEDNNTLETLSIANNGIDAIACFTICVGIIGNLTLKKVIFDGNPIAEQGARALMLVPMHAGGRVSLGAAKCNITMKDPRCWFDFTNPCRTFDLDMSNGFERAVAKVILMIVACHHSFVFESFEYSAKAGGKFVPIVLKQAVSKERVLFFSKRETEIVASLTKIVDSAADIKGAVRLFQEVDEDGSGEVDREELGVLINSMGINMTEARIDEIFNLYDVDGGGSIGLSEFLSFLKTQRQESSNRIKDMTEIPVMVALDHKVDEYGNPKQWIPPRDGILHIEVKDGFITKDIKRVMSSVDQKNIAAVIANASGGESTSLNEPGSGGGNMDAAGGGGGGSGGGAALLERGLVGTKLRLDEALACCSTMLADGRDNIKVLRSMLPQMEGFKDAQAIVKALTNGDRSELMKLKREIGMALRPILGAPNGYYILDLADEMDRFCMIRLLEISKTQASKRQREHAFFENTQIGDLSQKRNWSCFRNEQLNSEPVSIDEHFASPLPRKGMLEFDFICATRPSRDDVVLPDTRIVKVLVNSFMLEPEDSLKALHRLKHYRDAGESTLDCDGHTVYEPTTKRAHAIGLAIDDFYMHLPKRLSMYQQTISKEGSIKMDIDGRVIDDLEEDNVIGHSEHNKDNFFLSLSAGMRASIKTSGFDKNNKGSKKFRSHMIGSDSGNEDEDNSHNEEADENSSAPRENNSDSHSENSVNNFDGDDEPPNYKNWACTACLTSNTFGIAKCSKCNKTNPDYVMGHGIDIEFDPKTIGTRKNSSSHLLVQSTRKAKGMGAIESGFQKADNAGMLDGTKLMSVKASDHALHDAHEMDSNYSSDLENNDHKEDNFSQSSSSSSSSDDEDGEDTDIKRFMKMKIKEKEMKRKERIRVKRELAQAKLLEEQKKMYALNHADDFDRLEGGSVEGSVDNTSGAGAGTGVSVGGTQEQGPTKDANIGNVPSPVQTGQEQVDENGILRRAGGVTDTKAEAAKIAIDLLNADANDDSNSKNEKVHKKTEMELFAEKMSVMLETPTMHIGLKAHRIIEWMEETFGRVWILSRHLMLLLQCFRGLGHKKQTKYFGTYRVDLCVALFHRVVDVHNFEIVLKCLSPFEAAAVHARIGWLHLWNPCKPEGGWELDLTRPEERLIAKMCCELATVEPGDNWIEQFFQWQRDVDGMPGWELTTPWLTEEGMPCRGILTIYYYSGDGKGLKQCKPHVPFRKSLLQQVLINEYDIVEEGFRDRPPKSSVGEPYMYNNSARWKQYLGCIVDLTRVR